jgi:hypothetical protein
MNLEDLKAYLDRLTNTIDEGNRNLLKYRLSGLASAFPFNEYEYILIFLFDKKAITFKEYEELREQYVSENKYLDLYDLAPRSFGDTWGHPHIMDLDDRFVRPSRELDPDYDGEYDLLIEGVKVEVKASRATHKKKKGDLASKGLRYGDDQPFWMNFQQIKLGVADVFIFIGVWVDTIVYWVLSNEEVKNSKHRSPQHRGGIESQIGITDTNVSEFDVYKADVSEIGDKVLKKAGVI